MTAVEVLQVQSELDQMMALHAEVQPRRVLEIGCWDGGTLREWLTHAPPNSFVAAVDLEHRNAVSYTRWKKPDTYLRLFTGDSRSAEAHAFIAENGPYDWVFVDGDHGEQGIRNDIAACLPHIADGGLLLMHDIVAEHGWAGDGISAVYPPGRVLAEFQTAGCRTAAFVDPGVFGSARGIGVVWL